MKSTGEIMGWDRSFPLAFAKAQIVAGMPLPRRGRILFEIEDHQERGLFIEIAESLKALSYEVFALADCKKTWQKQGIDCHIEVMNIEVGVNEIQAGNLHILVSVSQVGKPASRLRHATLFSGIPYFTRLSNARSLVRALRALHQHKRANVCALQNIHV
jgi:carbamoyl-phosphate synthase large subunit